MNKKKSLSEETKSLRIEAEKQLVRRAGKVPPKDIEKLIHELQVHQVELEMQNEELRSAQATIEKSRSRYADLYDFAPVGYFTFDEKGLIREVNLTGAGLLGVARGTLMGRPFFTFVMPGFRDLFRSHQRSVMATGRKQTCELGLQKKDQTPFYISMESVAVSDKDGNPAGCRSIASDITARRNGEEKLRESNELLEAVFSDIHFLVAYLDPHFNIIRVNLAYARSHGRDPGFFSGKNLFELMPHKDNEGIFRYVVSTGEPYFAFEQPMSPDGGSDAGSRYWDVSLQPVKDTNQQVQGLILSLVDRTQHRFAREALLKTEQLVIRLATAVEQVVEGVAITDVHGMVEYVNPAFERITGYGRDEVADKPFGILRSDSHDERPYEAIWGTLGSGRAWTGRLTSRKKDGSFYEAERSISAIKDPSGVITNYVSVERDITDQVQMEKRFRQTNTMEAIGTLAGGVAHDFNNVLEAIIGYTELVSEDLPEDSSSQRFLSQVLKAAGRAKDLVTAILAFSRKSERTLKLVRVASVIHETMGLMGPTLPSTIEVRTYLCDADMISADPTEAQQVLLNLCSNAVHSMRTKGGILDIGLTECYVDDKLGVPGEMKSGPYLKLTVSDTGSGMDTEVMEKIFDPFFTTKSVGEGTGLGLSIVYRIVKNYGGSIQVHSEKGKGSTFTVYFPKAESLSDDETRVRSTASTGKGRILFVDDEEALVDMRKTMLERLGYEVVATTKSIEAMKRFMADATGFDLVLTDQTMPDMTGAELAEKLMRIRPDIPIILCTGFSDVISKEDAMAMGVREFVVKPFTREEIAETIRRALAKKTDAA